MIRKLYLLFLFWLAVFVLYFPNSFFNESNLILIIRNISLLSFVISILPKKIDVIISTLILFFIAIYIGVQTTYFEAFNLYGLTKTLWSMKSGIVEYTTSIIEFMSLSDVKYFIVPVIYAGISILSFKKIDIFHKNEKRITNITLMILLLLVTIFSGFKFNYDLNKTETDDLYLLRTSHHYIYHSVENVSSFVNRFGLFNLIFRDMSSYFLYPYLESPNIEEEITALLKDRVGIQTSDYSGLFEGKSLILIEAESLNNFAIDPFLTPTLYKLKSEGLFVEGYNSPLLTGSTSDSEFLALTSLFPTFDGKITFNDYADNVYPQSLAFNLENEGYFNIAVHNNYGDYYNRDVMFPNLGLTFFDAVGMGLYVHVDDSIVLDYMKWITFGMEKSMSFFVTYDGHQPYSENNLTDLMKPYLSVVQKQYPNMPIAEQVYLAKNMDLDAGLEKLLIDYENSGVLDNTVIMIYGDHYPKGLFENENDYLDNCNSRGMSIETCFDTPLIIYNSEIKSSTINKVSTTLDIAPTIYDLFAIEYDPMTTFGHSIFDPTYDGFAFSAWDVIKTDLFTYDPGRDTVVNKDANDTNNYLDEARRLFYEYSTLRKIVPLDYFNSDIYKETFEND